LESNDAGQVGRVMSARLSEQDIVAEDALVEQIDAYLVSDEVEPVAKETLIVVLEGIEAGERPRWSEQVKIWRGWSSEDSE